MKLIIGGAYQGKLAYAKREYGMAEGWIDGHTCRMEEIWTCGGIDHFHEYIRRMMTEGPEADGRTGGESRLTEIEQNAERFAEKLFSCNPDLVIVSNELGYGVVPMEKKDRLWREMCGRVCTCIAEKAQEVVRVVCGIGIRLKPEPAPETAGHPIDSAARPVGSGRYFPLFADLSDKRILIVGAGMIAARRLRVLCAFAGQITVTAPRVSEEVELLLEEYSFRLLKRPFRESDLDTAQLVLAATDDASLNCRIAKLCRQRNIPVNDCSDRRNCDFQFPSVVCSGDVVIGINASGKDHRLVKETRKKIERCMNNEGSSQYTDA